MGRMEVQAGIGCRMLFLWNGVYGLVVWEVRYRIWGSVGIFDGLYKNLNFEW